MKKSQPVWWKRKHNSLLYLGYGRRHFLNGDHPWAKQVLQAFDRNVRVHPEHVLRERVLEARRAGKGVWGIQGWAEWMGRQPREQRIIEHLCKEGYLKRGRHKSSATYGHNTLAITEKGLAFLDGERDQPAPKSQRREREAHRARRG